MSGPTGGVDWSGLTPDPATATAVAELGSLASGLDPTVPAVLLPLRVETRFTTVEVPDAGHDLTDLLARLADVLVPLRRLAGRPYATELAGSVRDKQRLKDTLERPLYDAADADLTALDEALAALDQELADPVTAGTPGQERRLADAVTAVRGGLAQAGEALTQLRSDFQRARLTVALGERSATATGLLQAIERRVRPGLRLIRDLDLRAGAATARALGRDPDGRPLRPGLPPAGAPRTGPRVVLDDDTTAEALGAAHLVRLERSQLVAAAAAADLVAARLDDPGGALDEEVRTAAAGIVLLPGDLKAALLDRLDRAAGRPGAAELRAEIAATPSDRPDLDVDVPDRAAATVFTVAGPSRTEHQLLVRLYPEPLAVDTHEEGLTELEQADGERFWVETASAGTDEERRRGAWRALCLGRSTRRAAWVARVTEPARPEDTAPTPGAVAAAGVDASLAVLEKRLSGLRPEGPSRPATAVTERQRAAVERALDGVQVAVAAADVLPEAAIPSLTARLETQAAAVLELTRVLENVPDGWPALLAELARAVADTPVEAAPEPTLPTAVPRTGTWTRAASSTVLPDRFAVFTVSGGRAGTVAAGRRVPADLKLGLDPLTDTFAVDEAGGLVVPDSIRWMTDFDEAEERGLALRVTLTPEQAAGGLDELLVVGLCDGDADDGTDRLTAMLEAHHYTGDGLALLPVGTATNNTEDQQSGFASADDPDRAYPVERGAPLVEAAPDTDGARLAEALGVAADVFAHVRSADGTDAADALLANRVLYAGTIGHALEELAPGWIARDGRDRLRRYALDHVTARGLLPAVRVDDQPYGLLPAIALSRYAPDLRDSGQDAAPAGERARQQRFEATLGSVLGRLHEDWSRLRLGLDDGEPVKHAASPSIGEPGFDAQQHFLSMLGLEATSVEASYRFAVNVADRTGVRGRPELSLSFGIPPEDGSRTDSGSHHGAAGNGPFALVEHLQDEFRTALALPAASVLRDPATGMASADWDPVVRAVTESRAYGLRLLTGPHPLLGALVAPGAPGVPDTGAWIRSLLGLSMADLRARSESDLAGVGLAEMLVRQALLAEERRAAAALLVSRGLLSEAALAEIGSSGSYQTWTAGTLHQTSAWGLLFTSVDRLVQLGGSGAAVPADLAGRTLADVLAGGRPAEVGEHRTAVAAFANLPADRMTALTREHLDLGSHRLDAWLTGLAQRRLTTMRDRRARGVQVGAFGWVENLRPTSVEPTPATAVPPALAGLPGRPLVADPSDEGFVQTPSPTHAVTAAILRAAHRSQRAEGSLGNEMSVNLSSARVRVALGLLDGVRSGNDLGALLGYRLERFLHEYYARPDTPHVVELDSAIFPLRRAYPTVAPVDPEANAAPEPTRHVVDGLALVRTLLAWAEQHYPGETGTLFDQLWTHLADHPWGTKPGALPPRTDTDALVGVLRGIDAVADALDALGDLTTSETVHQLVRGNHARAAAVLAALSEGTAIPHPEVTDTPRTGLAVSHRLLLQLPAAAAGAVASPPGWQAVPPSPRAALEPAVNAWLAALLGDPGAIRVRLTSDALPPGTALPEVSLAELGLQPLDLVALLGDGFDAAVGTLTARVLDLLRPPDLPPDQPGVVTSDGTESAATDAWRIESRRAPAWEPRIRGITDVAPLLETCADLLGRARPAIAASYAAPEVTATAGDGVDLADLATRGRRLLDAARVDTVTLARLLAADPTVDAAVLDTEPTAWLAALRPPGTVDPSPAELDAVWAGRDTWRAAAAAAQGYGVRVGLPRRFLSRVQVATELWQSAEAAFVDLATRCRTATATLAAAGAAVPVPASTWTQVATDLLGEGRVLVPRVGVDPVRADLQTALAAGLAGADAVDAWLEGAAAVREGAADLATLQVLAEGLGRPALAGEVAQLPHRPGDPWLGGAVPDPTALTGRVCVVLYGADRLPAAGATGTALLVDEWTETVPFREEVTGVALHYDQPDATAPQAILVAVPPVLDQPWTLTDLAATLHDTLEIARNRMVEVEHIGASRYGQLLPLVLGEVVPDAARGGVAGDRVILDFHQNNPAPSRT